MRLLIIPDVHGRKFWEIAENKTNEYDQIIFLGDYLDPYPFENISVEDAIVNFERIIEFKEMFPDKVVLLLGNHDMPYFSSRYFSLSMYHSRHSKTYHADIKGMFKTHKDLFKLSHCEDNILFTHAGCTPIWIHDTFGQEYEVTDVKKLSDKINDLLNIKDGIKSLFVIGEERGGRNRTGSCIWADVHDTMWWQQHEPYDITPKQTIDVMNMKQVFGHTLQAFYQSDGSIGYGDAGEYGNNKMLDNCQAYELNTDTFTITQL